VIKTLTSDAQFAAQNTVYQTYFDQHCHVDQTA